MEAAYLSPLTLAAVVLVILAVIRLGSLLAWNRRSRGLPLPPGPKPFPIIGNVLNFPKTKQGSAFRAMCAQYGDILYLNFLGQHMIVLGSPEVTVELLEKRSANTSDRSVTPLFRMTSIDSAITMMQHDESWRRHKRHFWQHFRPEALPAYHSMQQNSVHRFLQKLLESPSRLKEHIRFSFSAAVLEILIGHTVADDGDEVLAIVEDALEWIGEASTPGRYLIETLPIIRSIPPWFPGAAVQKLIAHWRSTVIRLKEEPYRRVKAAMARNEALDSVVSKLITSLVSQDDCSEVEEEIKNVSATTIEAASDTMFSTVQTFFVAMALNPEVQKKAQAELDAVVGPHRLPDFQDQERLVYVNAVIRESLRWLVVLPLSIPHVSVKDDEFRGFFIPAGTVIMPNVWAFTRDPKLYKDPDQFRPERFIRDGKLDFTTAPDPALVVFGFGRRMCPGRYFGMNGLFINIASILHVLNIRPPLDEGGNAIALCTDTTDGLLCYPVDCRCLITARSADSQALINEACM